MKKKSKFGLGSGKQFKDNIKKIREGGSGKNLYNSKKGEMRQKDIKKRNKMLKQNDYRKDTFTAGGGKGDSPRSCFSEEYRENYDKIFGKKKDRKGGRTRKVYK